MVLSSSLYIDKCKKEQIIVRFGIYHEFQFDAFQDYFNQVQRFCDALF